MHSLVYGHIPCLKEAFTCCWIRVNIMQEYKHGMCVCVCERLSHLQVTKQENIQAWWKFGTVREGIS